MIRSFLLITVSSVIKKVCKTWAKLPLHTYCCCTAMHLMCFLWNSGNISGGDISYVMKKSLHLKLRDEGVSFRGTTLIDMLFRLLPFRSMPDAVRVRKITCPLKGFCSRVRHLNPYTVLHQPTARWNIFIKFIPFIASVLIYMYGTYYSPWKNVCQPGMGGIFDRTLKKLIFPENDELLKLLQRDL